MVDRCISQTSCMTFSAWIDRKYIDSLLLLNYPETTRIQSGNKAVINSLQMFPIINKWHRFSSVSNNFSYRDIAGSFFQHVQFKVTVDKNIHLAFFYNFKLIRTFVFFYILSPWKFKDFAHLFNIHKSKK